VNEDKNSMKKAPVAAHNWTAEKLSALDSIRLKTVKDNAARHGADALIVMCDAELDSRKSNTIKRSPKTVRGEAGDGYIVTEYHFVCRNDRGVTFNSDGTFWSTSWVAAEDVVKKSIQFGARLALHNSKAESSYRQGIIKGYRKVDDFADGKVESRIDFLVISESQTLEWAGLATGEKGYKRAKSSGNEVKTHTDAGEAP
jgi:hypothetical protein